MSYNTNFRNLAGIVLFTLLSYSANAQKNESEVLNEVMNYSTFSSNTSIDTVLQAEEFEVRITIAEYSTYKRIKRPHFIGKTWGFQHTTIDSMQKKFYAAIDEFGITEIPELKNTSKGVENVNTVRTFTLNLASFDSALKLYYHLDTALNSRGFVRYQTIPIFNSKLIDSVKNQMTKRALTKSRLEVEKFANSNDLRIVRVAFFNANFYQEYAVNGSIVVDINPYSHNNNFNISNNKVTYQLDVMFAYYLETIDRTKEDE